MKYVYDLENHLTRYDANGNGSLSDVGDATYGYDSEGKRISQTVIVSSDGQPTAQTTLYVVDANNPTGYSQVLEEKSAKNATPDKAYVLGQDIIAQQVARVLNYLLYDGHGNT